MTVVDGGVARTLVIIVRFKGERGLAVVQIHSTWVGGGGTFHSVWYKIIEIIPNKGTPTVKS